MTRGIDKGLRGCEALQIMYFVFSQVITELFLLSIHNVDPSDNKVILFTIKGPRERFGFSQDLWAGFKTFSCGG